MQGCLAYAKPYSLLVNLAERLTVTAAGATAAAGLVRPEGAASGSGAWSAQEV